MKASALIWWKERSGREQVLLAIMGLLVAVLTLWFAVVRPLDGWVRDGRETYRQALADRAALDRSIAEIRTIRAHPVAPLPKPLTQGLRDVALQAGFSDVQSEPGANGAVRLSIAAVRSEAFFPWLRTVVQRHGLIVESMNALPNSDRTLSVVVTVRERRQ